MTPQNPPITIIGIGNDFRGDDGVGLSAVRKIGAMRPGAVTLENRGDGAALIEAWLGKDHVIIIDAVHTGLQKPGTILRFDASRAPLSNKYFCCSTHAFGLSEAVELSRILGHLPKELVVYGMEVESLQPNQAMSTIVEARLPQLVDEVLAECDLLSEVSCTNTSS